MQIYITSVFVDDPVRARALVMTLMVFAMAFVAGAPFEKTAAET